MKKSLWVIFCVLALVPSLSFAGDERPERGALAGVAYLEGRGFSNILLFPAEWPHLASQEFGGHALKGTVTFLPVVLTHLIGRLFSGITDVVFSPIYYPISKYDDSIPKGMGWGEFPWQKGSNA